MIVDFPHPDGPTSETNAPASAASVTPSMAVTGRRPPNTFERRSSSMPSVPALQIGLAFSSGSSA